jgi:hypothetical protein
VRRQRARARLRQERFLFFRSILINSLMNLQPLPVVPSANEQALKLLDLLADPVAARKLLDEITRATCTAGAAVREAKEHRAAAVAAHAELNAERDTFHKDRVARSAYLASSGKAFDERESVLRDLERRLDDRAKLLDKKSADLDRRERAVQPIEEFLTATLQSWQALR